MKRNHDKRRHPRHSISGKITGYILPSHTEAEQSFQGTIHDISQGGLGVLAVRALTASCPIQCEVRLANVPCSIPTLTQVRWVKKTRVGVRIGLQFLL
jgi:c-di-GMP-binding flagellar brake protein YcgR